LFSSALSYRQATLLLVVPDWAHTPQKDFTQKQQLLNFLKLFSFWALRGGAWVKWKSSFFESTKRLKNYYTFHVWPKIRKSPILVLRNLIFTFRKIPQICCEIWLAFKLISTTADNLI
jgi:hypothetical protein